jgi:hypothetical protein
MTPRPIPPDAERCMAMTHRLPHAGERCAFTRATDQLCKVHARWGALVPDGWTVSGLPIFTLRRSR